MSSIVDVLSNLANQTGFASLDWKKLRYDPCSVRFHVPCN